MDAVSAKARTQADDRRIEGHGTPEAVWQSWECLMTLPEGALADLFPAHRRVVVVAPHPDDELLGCGGTLAMLAREGRQIVVVGVTDGEASHPESTRFSPRSLGAARRAERQSGLRALGLDGSSQRLGLPDGGITATEPSLAQSLEALLMSDDIVISTWRLDGHPDHEAAGRAAVAAARGCGCVIHEMPIWMWHWAAPDDPRVPWQRLRRVPIDVEAQARKSHAIAAHESQLLPDGDRDPILPGWALERVQRTFEYFFADAGHP